MLAVITVSVDDVGVVKVVVVVDVVAVVVVVDTELHVLHNTGHALLTT